MTFPKIGLEISFPLLIPAPFPLVKSISSPIDGQILDICPKIV